MSNKFFVDSFVEKFTDNYNEIMDLDDSLLRPMAYAQWKSLIVKRSARVREIFAENDAMIASLREMLQKGLEPESADSLYVAMRTLYERTIDDYGLMKMVCDTLIPYYEAKEDVEKLVFLYHMMEFESYEFKGRILEEEGCLEAISYFRKIQNFEDHYAEISDERIRKCFYTAYNNLIAPIAQTFPSLRDNIFSYYAAANALYQKEEVQRLDGGKEEFLETLEQIEEDVLFAEEYVWDCSSEFRQRYVDFVERLEADKSEDYTKESGSFIRAKIICRLMKGEILPKDAIEYMIAYIKQLPLPDYSDEEDMCSLLYLLNLHNSSVLVFHMLKTFSFDKADKEKYMKQFVQKVTDAHLQAPYDYCTMTMNQVCEEWYKEIVGFLDDFETKKEYLLQLIVCRQPTTYIHSQMVKEIVSLITQAVIKGMPQLLVGILGCENEEEVQARRSELLAYVENCGLLHDVGKCNVVELINKQSRRLTDEEFQIIKKHTTMGPQMLDRNEDFAEYYNIMEGHHKSYDGSFGYPKEFDNVNQRNHVIIDLVTIADCIDAATDTLGRNYAKGKDFATLAQELKQEAGTRYNPDIVEHIFKDKVLWNNLDYITSEGRGQIYYQVYQDILKYK